ncbi:MAG: glutamine synthetase family protein [Candidatus Latescibacteria bacterium]|nr:glutamine synthetase family protein [Candidatus Latescibacterota bacterium]
MTNRPRGCLHIDELRQLVADDQIDTVLAVFPDLYGRLMGKRITAAFFLEQTLGAGMHACDYLLTVDMEMDVVEGYEFANWASGYGDIHCVPDLSTLRQISWLERSAMVLCDLHTPDHELVPEAPRSMLRQQLQALAEAGYAAKVGTELEFYLFKDSYDEATAKRYQELETSGSYIEDYHILQGTKSEAYHGAVRRQMDASGIPIEFSKGEWGPGQHEINLRYAGALEMADRHVIYKHGCKEIAWQQDVSVSFMAKWDSELAGSSMHLHLSLWDPEISTNQFVGDVRIDTQTALGVSPLFRHFLGGWMKHAPELMPFYAPYPNSYKRYIHQSWAPTVLGWSRDNRTAGFRIVGDGPSLRIECRIPGADANPYLAMAATIAAGIDGIEKRHEAPPIFEGDVYGAAALPRVCTTLHEAIDAMDSSAFLRQTFADRVVDHYLHFFRTEQLKSDQAVTTWERARYFERG